MGSSIWDMAQRRSPGKYLVYSVSSQVGLSAGAEGSPEILGPSRAPNATIVHAPAVLVGERRRWALTLGRAVWGVNAVCLLSVFGLLCTHGHRDGPVRSGGARRRRQ